MYEEIIIKIKELGLNDSQASELFNDIAEEIADLMFQELAETTTDQELIALKTRFDNAKSTDHYESILKEVAITVYGDNALEELKQMFLEYIEEIKNTASQSRELLQKYNQGDPDAIALIEKAKQTDEFKSIIQTEE